MSSSSNLASQLRYLLSLLGSYSPQSLSYRETVDPEAGTGLQHLVPAVFSKVGVVQDVQYSILLLRRLILARFELLCASRELLHDVKYCYREIRDILLVVETFNSHCCATGETPAFLSCQPTFSSQSKERQWIELAGLIDVYVDTHTEWLCCTISDLHSSENIFHLAQFESSFIRALLGLLATYTSLLTGVKGRRKKYVSEEMFSMCSSQESVGWSDCLIPGAQSDTLRRTHHDISRRLWSKVAEGLVARTRPVVLANPSQEESVTEMLKMSGLESFPIVVSCLKHVMASYLQQRCLVKWDSAFQMLLAATLMEYRKSYRRLTSNPPTMAALCCNGLACLDSHMSEQVKTTIHVTSNSTPSIVAHLDILRQTLLVACAVKASLDHITFSILQGLSTSMCSWNLTSLAWIMFNDLPAITCALKRSITISYSAASPRVSFPMFSSLHSLECSCREICSSLHNTSTHLQETSEEFYRCFQTQWASRCAKVLKSGFPQAKYWKTFRIKEGSNQTRHSNYCDAVIECLFLPMTEAAVRLPHEDQKNFVYLMTTVFYHEYRKLITSNKKLYSVYAGRQLLTDHRYLQGWLASSDQQLSKPTLQLLSRAPTLMEVGTGLLSICNCGMEETDGADIEKPLDIALPSNSFPVLFDVSWNSTRDWGNCILY